jgi:hypothetical protein
LICSPSCEIVGSTQGLSASCEINPLKSQKVTEITYLNKCSLNLNLKLHRSQVHSLYSLVCLILLCSFSAALDLKFEIPHSEQKKSNPSTWHLKCRSKDLIDLHSYPQFWHFFSWFSWSFSRCWIFWGILLNTKLHI